MRLLSTLYGILICATCVAQDKIEGIGPFRINVTTVADFQQTAKDSHNKIGTIDHDETPAYNVSEILLNRKNPDDMHPDASYCPDGRVFYVERFKVAGITLKRLYLTFYKDRLVYLTCIPEKTIANALKLKYGEAVEETDDGYRYCGGVRYVSTTHWDAWRNGKIKAWYGLSEYRDYYCRLGPPTAQFSLFDSDNWDAYRTCNNDSRKSVTGTIRQSDKRTKAKLKDF